jgi:hypothetical protein
LDRLGSPPGRIVFAAVTGRWLRGLAGAYCRAARRRSSLRWQAISCSRYECIDVGPSPGDPWESRQFAVSAGLGKGDCLGVLPLARSPARASALARTTSGSRGSGGRTSCQRDSCRTLGRRVRICCTVSHLLGRPPHPVGAGGGQPGPGGRLFGQRYGFPPAWRVTRRCLPGGISRRGDLSPEGATGPTGVRCPGIRPSCRARAAASVRLAGPIMCAHRSR